MLKFILFYQEPGTYLLVESHGPLGVCGLSRVKSSNCQYNCTSTTYIQHTASNILQTIMKITLFSSLAHHVQVWIEPGLGSGMIFCLYSSFNQKKIINIVRNSPHHTFQWKTMTLQLCFMAYFPCQRLYQLEMWE